MSLLIVYIDGLIARTCTACTMAPFTPLINIDRILLEIFPVKGNSVLAFVKTNSSVLITKKVALEIICIGKQRKCEKTISKFYGSLLNLRIRPRIGI